MKKGDKVRLINFYGFNDALILSEISECGKFVKMKHQITGVTATRSHNLGEWFPMADIKLANPTHKDFMEFLTNNPPNEVQETTEPTEEQKAAWQAELDEHNRIQAEETNYYNPKTLYYNPKTL